MRIWFNWLIPAPLIPVPLIFVPLTLFPPTPSRPIVAMATQAPNFPQPLPARRDRGWRIPVMDRYLFAELLAPFLFGVGAFTALGVSLDSLFYLVNEILDSGLSITAAFEVLALKIPQFIAYSFPMSVLLSSLMTFSRLASDSELIALRSCGVTVYRMLIPTLIFCSLVTGLTFLFNESIVPAANYRASTTLTRALNNGEEPRFREEDILYQEFDTVTREDGDRGTFMSRMFYAKAFDGEQMKGLTILDFSRGSLEQIISAQSARWNEDTSAWTFYNGTIYVVSADGSFRNIIKFEEQTLNIPRSPLDLATRNRGYSEMNIAQSQEYLRLVEQSGDADKIRELQVRIHQKYALPFTCIAFGVVGMALGSQLRRTGRAVSFALSILLVFSYYILAFLSGAIAQVGLIPPILGAWLPNLFGFGVGAFFLHRASR